jgi:hypothetical protein
VHSSRSVLIFKHAFCSIKCDLASSYAHSKTGTKLVSGFFCLFCDIETLCSSHSKSFNILGFGTNKCFHTFQGEQYKLFWPEHPEFVRTAARFGAKIVPFGVVGEDDFGEVSPAGC